MKSRIYQILENGSEADRWSRIYDLFMLTVIILNVIFLCLETVDGIDHQWHLFFVSFEWISVLLFTVEYGLRLWVCTESSLYQGQVKGRLKFMTSFMGMVDLLSFLPFYLFLYSSHAKYLSIIRLFRLIRLVKLAEYSQSLSFLAKVIRKRKDDLITTGFVTFILLICASTIMYILESQAQSDKFSSIPMAMWWGVTALTTVGYGDVYPITPLGKVFASLVAILGIGVFALPAGILGASFLEELQASKFKKLEDLICEHCGKTVSITSMKSKVYSP
jgi:voltage-gated potassium channel